MEGTSFRTLAQAERPVPETRQGINSSGKAQKTDDESASGEPSPLQVDLPSGWRVDRVVPARFLANGLCSPGLVALKMASGEVVTIEVRGPVCEVELVPVGGRT